MRKTIPTIFLMLSFCGFAFAQTQNSTAENRVETVNVAGTEIKTPIKLLSFDSYRDGGTVYAEIEDALGKKLTFCVDKRIDDVNPRKFKNIYLGITHPSEYDQRQQGTQLSIAGNEEKALLKVLKNWKETVVSKEKQVKILEIMTFEGRLLGEAVWSLDEAKDRLIICSRLSINLKKGIIRRALSLNLNL